MSALAQAMGSLAWVGMLAVGGCQTSERPCEQLTALSLFDVEILAVEDVGAAGPLPAHCKVEGVIGEEINFELLLPDDWNGKFAMGGGGGFGGTVQNQAQAKYKVGGTALDRGYATVGLARTQVTDCYYSVRMCGGGGGRSRSFRLRTGMGE